MYQDYKDLLSAFHAHGVRYLIVGGYAAIFHAQPRFTRDLDFFIKADPANAQATCAALTEFGAALGRGGSTIKRYRLDPKKPRQLTFAEAQTPDATPIDYSDIPAPGMSSFLTQKTPGRRSTRTIVRNMIVRVGENAENLARTLIFCERTPAAITFERGLFPMEKESIISRKPPLPTVPPRTEPPVRTMPMEKARKLIRKTASEHAGLFRRLAK